MKRCSTLLATEETQIKTTERPHPHRTAGRKSWTVTRAGEDVERSDPDTRLVGMEHGAATVGNSLVVPREVKHRVFT